MNPISTSTKSITFGFKNKFNTSKKVFLLLFILSLQFAPAKAQFVTIPDVTFVSKLTQLFPACMNGNQLDTTCVGILTEDTLIFNGAITGADILNISGIEYFDNLLFLEYRNSTGLTVNISRLPPNLKYLRLNNQNFTSLPPLPNNLRYLYASDNQLGTLPALPNTLRELECNSCELTSLPTFLNDSLRKIFVNSNQLNELPVILPDSLEELYCGNNQLTTLPPLPSTLFSLVCPSNQITVLPVLPSNLVDLFCSNNLISTIPPVPNVMLRFMIENNNITCVNNLPEMPQFGIPNQFNISNNPLPCIPNATQYASGILCLDEDSINNPYNCISTVNISGKIYSDLNNNCILNGNDLNISNIPVQIYDSLNNLVMQNYSQNGSFGFPITQAGAYKVKLKTNNLPIAMSCSQADSIMINLYSSTSYINYLYFPVQCNQAYDIRTQSISTMGWVFPGQIHQLITNISNNEMWNNLICDTLQYSGTVMIEINGSINYISSSMNALVPQINGNIFTYTISDFNNLTPESFALNFMTDTTAQANEQICVHVEINPTPFDSDSTNNVYDFCYNVVNSYDPNMKEVYPVNVLPGYDDWFTYTIHFQNTGNAPAFNIRLRDTLDTQLDLNTFEVLGYSHTAATTLSGNILTVRLNNIMLPDSTSDYEGSMGYYQYRIKPIANLPNGSQIENTAYIYFDYNAPIVTNTTTNNFDITVPVANLISTENGYIIYPNPSSGIFTFKDSKNIKTIEVYNLMGELVLSQGNAKQINLQGFPQGIYVAKINGQFVSKLVKE